MKIHGIGFGLAMLAGLVLLCGCSDTHSGDFARFARITVAPGPNNPPASASSPSATGVCVQQLTWTAGPDEAVRVSSLRFREYGTALAQSAISTMGLWVDADGDGAYSPAVDTTVIAALPSGYASDDTALFSGLDRVIASGATEHWILVYNLSGAGIVGETLAPSLDGEGDVSAFGAESGRDALVEGPPVSGNSLTLLNIGALALSLGANNAAASGFLTPAPNIPMIQVRLEAGAIEDVAVSAVTFTAGGTGNADADISMASLYNDLDGSGTLTAGDTQIGNVETFSGGLVSFTGLAETIAAGPLNGEDWILICSFTGGNVGDTYSVRLATGTDVSATGAVSAASIFPSGTPLNGNDMTVASPAGSPQINLVDLLLGGNVTVHTVQADVILMRFRLTTGPGEGVVWDTLTLHAFGTGDDQRAVSSVSLFHDANVDGILQKEADPLVSASSYGAVYSADNGTATFSGLNHTLGAGTSGEYLVVYSFSGSGLANSRFQVTFAPAVDLTGTGASSASPATVTGTSPSSYRVRLFGDPAWTQAFATVPAGYVGQHGHCAVYDGANRRIVLFGGVTGLNAVNNDSWEIDLTPATPTWTQLTPGPSALPGARHGHSAVFVPASMGGPKMIVFGGYGLGGTPLLQDVWELNLQAGLEDWTQLSPSGGPPGARCYHSAVFDASNNRMIVYGGSADRPNIWGAPPTRTLFNDVWALDLGTAAWSPLTTTGTPPPASQGRAGHAAVYDALAGRMIVFGGCDFAVGGAEVYYGDVYALDLGTLQWSALSNTGTPPSARYLHCAVADEIGRRVFLFGGGTDNPPGTPVLSYGIFVYNLSASQASWTNGPWTALPAGALFPAARYNHAGAYDPVRNRSVQVTGFGTADAWEYE